MGSVMGPLVPGHAIDTVVELDAVDVPRELLQLLITDPTFREVVIKEYQARQHKPRHAKV